MRGLALAVVAAALVGCSGLGRVSVDRDTGLVRGGSVRQVAVVAGSLNGGDWSSWSGRRHPWRVAGPGLRWTG